MTGWLLIDAQQRRRSKYKARPPRIARERGVGRKAGQAQALSGEAFFCLDFFVTFCIKTKLSDSDLMNTLKK